MYLLDKNFYSILFELVEFDSREIARSQPPSRRVRRVNRSRAAQSVVPALKFDITLATRRAKYRD